MYFNSSQGNYLGIFVVKWSVFSLWKLFLPWTLHLKIYITFRHYTHISLPHGDFQTLWWWPYIFVCASVCVSICVNSGRPPFCSQYHVRYFLSCLLRYFYGRIFHHAIWYMKYLRYEIVPSVFANRDKWKVTTKFHSVLLFSYSDILAKLRYR